MSSKKKSTKLRQQILASEPFYASPLYDFLSPFKPVANQWCSKYIIILFALTVRCAIGLGSYSGKNTPPMFGDFEAQRHWMELTSKLPINKWYWYDLKYWGLDYPPLTAYHSYILGKLGSFFNPTWFDLDISRGCESTDLKSYMNFTVLISELVCYIPAVIYFSKWMGKHRSQSPVGQYMAAAAILFQPSLMLIDYGHFQYNSVMLGLTVYSINNLLDEFYAPAAICFVLSMCFKQMALYYSPIFFSYLLSKSLYTPRFNLPRFISVSIATVLTFLIMFGPLYIFGDFSNVLQSIQRIFPLERGLFEDKVANFWCVSNVFIKYKEVYTPKMLQLYSLTATFIAFLPSVIIIFLYPKKHILPYALTASSMSFFFFSFQVHEKTILLCLLPITLLYISTDWTVLSMVNWMNNIGLYTLWPLLKKDGLQLQYLVILFWTNWLLGNFNLFIPKFILKLLSPNYFDYNYKQRVLLPDNVSWKVIIISSYILMLFLHLAELFIQPPKRYPDIWVVANCTLGFCCFLLFWFWNYYKLISMRNKSIALL